VPQREAARLLAACDVLLSPHSRHMSDRPFFGSPTKLFEYMAYGAGIVCSDLVQLGEVMRPALMLGDERAPEGARSILVRPGSSEDLVAGSVRLIDDPALRETLGANARAAAARYYTWDEHVQVLWRFAKGLPPGGYHADRVKA
jgi:glycosyltransferase involved in cell wall biosynthesis